MANSDTMPPAAMVKSFSQIVKFQHQKDLKLKLNMEVSSVLLWTYDYNLLESYDKLQ